MSACPQGYVRRASYTRKASNSIIRTGYTVLRKGKRYTVRPTGKEIHVPSSCVKRRGTAKKMSPSSTMGKLRKGDLIKYGYQYRLSDRTRQKALKKAITVYGALTVFHKLDAVAKLTIRQAPSAHMIFMKDRDWVHSHYSM